MGIRNVGLIAVTMAGLALTVPAAGELVKSNGRWIETSAGTNDKTPGPAGHAPVGAPLPDIWGSGVWQSYTVGACDAVVLSGTWSDSSCDWAQSVGPASVGIGYPIHLPSGALAEYIRIYYHQEDFGSPISAGFYRSSTYGTSTLISPASPPSINTGDSYQDFGPFAETVNNDPNSGYTYEVDALFGGTTRIYKFAIWYLLQVSPAPATATFADVPTNYWAFRYIEALYASGITAGCGTNPLVYCPDRSVTRAEMAVYLAKALGLYWPF